MEQPTYTLTCEEFLDDNVHEAKLQQTDTELKDIWERKNIKTGKCSPDPI